MSTTLPQNGSSATAPCLNVPPLFPGHDGGAREAAMLEADAGRNLGFTRLLALKK